MATAITPFMTSVLACICTQLSTDGRPACECCQQVGQPVMDGCDCVCEEDGQGRAWITFLGADFTQTAPAHCPTGVWEARFQAGVLRCITDHSGACADSTVDAAGVAEDTTSIVEALTCCSAFTGRIWRMTGVEVVGPAGGCVGVSASFNVQFTRLSTV